MTEETAPEAPPPPHDEFDARLESLRRELARLRRWIGRERASHEPRSFDPPGGERPGPEDEGG